MNESLGLCSLPNEGDEMWVWKSFRMKEMRMGYELAMSVNGGSLIADQRNYLFFHKNENLIFADLSPQHSLLFFIL